MPQVELNRLPSGLFHTRGWPDHAEKPMESVVNRVPADHLYFSFLVEGTPLQILRLGWSGQFAATKVLNAFLLTGSLTQWMNAIRVNCSDTLSDIETRRFYNAIQVFLTYGGLDRLWPQYKKPLPDGTFILCSTDQ